MDLKLILDNTKGLVIHGLATVETPDTSAEIVQVEGIDLTDMEENAIQMNVEHVSPDKGDNKGSLECIIGHFIYLKKLYSLEDCENDDQRELFNKFELPCLYGIAELFTHEGHVGALNAAAILRYYRDRGLPSVARMERGR